MFKERCVRNEIYRKKISHDRNFWSSFLRLDAIQVPVAVYAAVYGL